MEVFVRILLSTDLRRGLCGRLLVVQSFLLLIQHIGHHSRAMTTRHLIRSTHPNKRTAATVSEPMKLYERSAAKESRALPHTSHTAISDERTFRISVIDVASRANSLLMLLLRCCRFMNVDSARPKTCVAKMLLRLRALSFNQSIDGKKRTKTTMRGAKKVAKLVGLPTDSHTLAVRRAESLRAWRVTEAGRALGPRPRTRSGAP